MIGMARKRGKYKHHKCPYSSDDLRYHKWYYRNVTKPKRKKQKRKKGRKEERKK